VAETTSSASKALGELLNQIFEEGKPLTAAQAAQIRRLSDSIGRDIADDIYIAVLRQNAALKHQVRELQDETKNDGLTKTLTQRYFKEFLPEALRQIMVGAHRQQEQHPSLIVLDIQDFKEINDRLSHLVGNEVLVRMTQTVQEGLRSESLIAKGDKMFRWGGDEFVIFSPGHATPHDVYDMCRRLMDRIKEIDWSDLGHQWLIDNPPVFNVGAASVLANSFANIERKYQSTIVEFSEELGNKWFSISDALMYRQKHARDDTPVIRFLKYHRGDLHEVSDRELKARPQKKAS
jgi:diguanylate cyclase (GGDEF)-like protein